MAKKCQITGKKAKVGNNVSHSKRRTKMRQEPNLQWKRFWLPEENRWVKIRVSTSVIRTIAKKGLMATLRKTGTVEEILG